MLRPPIAPMLASPRGDRLPDEVEGLSFEPKWDGFRCLVFRGTDPRVVLQGRGRSASSEDVVDLSYAFPELVESIDAQVPEGTVLDGEIVCLNDGRLDFALLSSRLRPRSEAGGPSIARLARESPASYLAFDVLWSGIDLCALPLVDRRTRLAALAADWRAPVLLTPTTTDPAIAQGWFDSFESAGVDGLIVKPLADPYVPGKRTQGKIKHRRTADVVVAGWRPHSRPAPDGSAVVGSLLLGLHDASGVLQYVGAASGFTAGERAELVGRLAGLALTDPRSPGAAPHPWLDGQATSVPGTANRWRREQDWVPVRPELVAEVAYDQWEGTRFRHVAGLVRWRPDRGPSSCDLGQLEIPAPARIEDLLIDGPGSAGP